MAGGTASIQEETSIPNSLRFILATAFVGVGFYSLTIAFYNASMSALETYTPTLGTLEVRFWSFIALVALLIAADGLLFMATNKKINHDDRQINS